jgi:hypothetical protein
MPETAAYGFVRQGRSPVAIAAAAAWIALIMLLVLGLQAAWWLPAVLALPLLLVLADLWRNPSAGLELDQDSLRWFSGGREATVALEDIEKMRFDTRWDFSVRVTVLTRDGKKTRMPQECVPPHREFEAELTARGVLPERHHFTVF